MAAPEAAAPPHASPTPPTTLHNTPARSATKSFVTREYDLTIRAFFPTPAAPMKFNPTSAMQQLIRTMLKDEPSLVLRTPNNDKQIVLASETLPAGEKAFKQFFKVSTPRAERQNPMYVCIGCNVLSNRTLGSIKFHSSESNLLTWLKKGKIFIESDSLGVDRPVTVGYFSKIDPTITHLANFNAHLVSQLMLIDIDVDTAIELAPYLKTAQLEAMSNGDEFVTILPPFEVYKTRLTHGRDSNQTTTEVIGVKGAPKDAKLLSEFFTRMATELSNDSRDGVFLPKGAAHLLGPATYAQVLHENNFFLNHVVTIPVNMEYGAWFAVIDPDNHSENDPISLHDHLLRQPWFLRVEAVSRTKCFIVTTKSNLPEARQWIDDNLERLIRKSIPTDVDAPPSSLPRRLDKPVYTTTSRTYAEILKKQFSLESTTNTATTATARPPRKRQATIIDYDSDQSSEYPPLVSNVVKSSSNNPSVQSTTDCTSALLELKNEINLLKTTMSPPNITTTATVDYAAELAALKNDLQSLRSLITTAVEQLKTEIATTHATPATNAMETDTDPSTPPTPELSDLIAELKNEIATMATEMRAKFQEIRAPAPIPFEFTPFPT